ASDLVAAWAQDTLFRRSPERAIHPAIGLRQRMRCSTDPIRPQHAARSVYFLILIGRAPTNKRNGDRSPSWGGSLVAWPAAVIISFRSTTPQTFAVVFRDVHVLVHIGDTSAAHAIAPGCGVRVLARSSGAFRGFGSATRCP